MAAESVDNIVTVAAVAALSDVVPQTYGEAVGLWGPEVISCPSHEWDNRTTWENTQWLLRRLVTICPPLRGGA